MVFGTATLTNVHTIELAAGNDYDLTTNDATVAGAATLVVDALALGAGDQLIFDGSAETNGKFLIAGGAGSDTLSGGAGDNSFDLTSGGNDTAYGGGGGDTVYAGSSFDADDSVYGGSGSDNLTLAGDYSAGYTFTTNNLDSVESLTLQGAFSYDLATVDNNVASGQTLTIDASTISGPHALTFDGSAETDGGFLVTGSGGDDIVRVGSVLAASAIDGGAGSDDTVSIDGDYSGANALTFGATTISERRDAQDPAAATITSYPNNAKSQSARRLTVDGPRWARATALPSTARRKATATSTFRRLTSTGRGRQRHAGRRQRRRQRHALWRRWQRHTDGRRRRRHALWRRRQRHARRRREPRHPRRR